MADLNHHRPTDLLAVLDYPLPTNLLSTWLEVAFTSAVGTSTRGWLVREPDRDPLEAKVVGQKIGRLDHPVPVQKGPVGDGVTNVLFGVIPKVGHGLYIPDSIPSVNNGNLPRVEGV